MCRLLSRVFMLGFLALAVSCWMLPSVSSAEDVWVFSKESDGHKFDYYLSTEKVSLRNSHPPYSCLVKILYDGQYDNFETLGFASQNDILVGYSFWRSKGKWDYIGKVREDPYLSAVWEAAKPYFKQLGVQCDNWH